MALIVSVMACAAIALVWGLCMYRKGRANIAPKGPENTVALKAAKKILSNIDGFTIGHIGKIRSKEIEVELAGRFNAIDAANKMEVCMADQGLHPNLEGLHCQLGTAMGNFALIVAKKYVKTVEDHPLRCFGKVRDKFGAECLAVLPNGTKFLIGEDGEMVWARPKGKYLSKWSQC